jgi:hypothetical protein
MARGVSQSEPAAHATEATGSTNTGAGEAALYITLVGPRHKVASDSDAAESAGGGPCSHGDSKSDEPHGARNVTGE